MATSAEAALGRGALIFLGLGMLNQLAQMSGLKRGEFHGAAFADLAAEFLLRGATASFSGGAIQRISQKSKSPGDQKLAHRRTWLKLLA
jgi:hypothetical protein